MTWLSEPLTAFDLETTSAEPDECHIVTATLVTIRPNAEPVVDSWLADPGCEIPAEASEIHGISTEHAREHGEPLAKVVAEVAAGLMDAWSIGPVIAYNASFDLTVVTREVARLGGQFEVAGYVIDPMVIDKGVDRYRKGSRKLGDVCAHYGVKLDNAHDATEDALAAARLAWVLARRYPRVGETTLDELHGRQRRWFAEQQESFADYLAVKVAPGIADADERAAVVARANRIAADADGWPVRGAA